MPSANDEDERKKINISSNQGKVIGTGVDGDGNIIAEDISIVINEFTEMYALTLIPPDYFKENTDTDEDFNEWRKGYSFSLPSIYQRKEYRREKVISEIKIN